MIRVVIVEDNDTILNGLVTLINEADHFKCIAGFQNCEKMLADIEKIAPDIVLIDLGLSGMSGISCIKKVRTILPDPCILILTISENAELIFQALCAGACGYLLKHQSSGYLLEAIREASQGGAPMSSQIARQVLNLFQKKMDLSSTGSEITLSNRELEVLTQLVEGLTYQEIADSLAVSIDIIRFHIRNIYRKLHVHYQSEAVARALKDRSI